MMAAYCSSKPMFGYGMTDAYTDIDILLMGDSPSGAEIRMRT